MLSFVVLIGGAVAPVSADVEIQELSKVFDKFMIGGDFNLFYRFDTNPYYGADIAILNPEIQGSNPGSDTDWGETFNRIRFTAEKNVGWTTLTGHFSPYFAGTFGQDVYGLAKDDTHADIDQAYIKFGKIGHSPFDITVGQQDIKIEKWFLVADGDNQPVANWLYFKNAFPMAIRVDGDHGALKSTLFWAKVGEYSQNWAEGPEDDMDAGGLNLHYDINDKMFVYGGAYRKDETANASMTENDTWAFDIGVDLTPVEGLQLEGEFVYETGDVIDTASGQELDRKAYGGFGAVTYTFPVRFAPYVRGSYIYFSGDDDLNDDDVETYDPMFYGFKQWNRWVVGELVGETQLPNFNKQVWIAEVGFMPIEPMTISLMYMQHRLAESNFMGGPVGSKDWADEINLFMDYPIGDHLFLGVGVGYIDPNDAAEEVFGDDEKAYFGQMFLSFYF
jgi:hypothetical protein